MQTAALLQNHHQETELTLMPGILYIGSADDNDLVISGSGVSAYHAKIITYFHQSVLIDLSSQTGTYLNNERVIKHTVKNGDVIQLGEHVFRIRICPEI